MTFLYLNFKGNTLFCYLLYKIIRYAHVKITHGGLRGRHMGHKSQILIDKKVFSSFT